MSDSTILIEGVKLSSEPAAFRRELRRWLFPPTTMRVRWARKAWHVQLPKQLHQIRREVLKAFWAWMRADRRWCLGKYAGSPIEAVPPDYLNWMLSWSQLDDDHHEGCCEAIKAMLADPSWVPMPIGSKAGTPLGELSLWSLLWWRDRVPEQGLLHELLERAIGAATEGDRVQQESEDAYHRREAGEDDRFFTPTDSFGGRDGMKPSAWYVRRDGLWAEDVRTAPAEKTYGPEKRLPEPVRKEKWRRFCTMYVRRQLPGSRRKEQVVREKSFRTGRKPSQQQAEKYRRDTREARCYERILACLDHMEGAQTLEDLMDLVKIVRKGLARIRADAKANGGLGTIAQELESNMEEVVHERGWALVMGTVTFTDRPVRTSPVQDEE